MSDLSGMIRAFEEDVITHPLDDAPRLIYADWIAEHAEQLPESVRDRGTLIRLHYALEAMPPEDLRRKPWIAAAGNLIRRNQSYWLSRDNAGCEMRRGFVEGCTFWSSVNPGKAPFERFPLRRISLRWFNTNESDPQYQFFARNPHLRQRVDELEVSIDNDTSKWKSELQGELDLPHLRKLELSSDADMFFWHEFGPRERLAELIVSLGGESPSLDSLQPGPACSFAALRQLTVHAGMYPERMSRFLAHHQFPALRHLRLDQTLLGQLTRPLLPDPLANQLERLELTACEVRLDRLTADHPFAALEHLNISFCHAATNIWTPLLPERFPLLRSLRANNLFQASGFVNALRETSLPSQLHTLHLSNCGLRSEDLVPLLRELPHRPRSLDLSWNRLDRVTLEAIVEGNGEPLEALDLGYAHLSAEALEPLAALPPGLKVLSLSSNGLDDETLAQMLDWPVAQSLEVLDLSHNHLSDNAVGSLLAWPRLPALGMLVVQGNTLSTRANKRLRRAMSGILV